MHSVPSNSDHRSLPMTTLDQNGAADLAMLRVPPAPISSRLVMVWLQTATSSVSVTRVHGGELLLPGCPHRDAAAPPRGHHYHKYDIMWRGTPSAFSRYYWCLSPVWRTDIQRHRKHIKHAVNLFNQFMKPAAYRAHPVVFCARQ